MKRKTAKEILADSFRELAEERQIGADGCTWKQALWDCLTHYQD